MRALYTHFELNYCYRLRISELKMLLPPRYLQEDSEIHDIFHVSLSEQDYKEGAGVQDCYANTSQRQPFILFSANSSSYGLIHPLFLSSSCCSFDFYSPTSHLLGCDLL